MAKLLAIEWDEREARVAVATPHGSEVVVEDAFAIDISGVVAADATDDSREVGQCIAHVLAQRGLTGSDALVGLASIMKLAPRTAAPTSAARLPATAPCWADERRRGSPACSRRWPCSSSGDRCAPFR